MPPPVPLFATNSSSCIGAARRRLSYAVAASVVAHFAVLTALIEDVPSRSSFGIARPLTANLAAPAESPIANAPHHSDPVPETTDARPPPEPVSRALADPIPKARSGADARMPGEALRTAPPPIVTEPAYYPAHELDIFPHLSQPLGPGDAAPDDAPRHRVRLELLIGADGVVRKVSVLDANSSNASAAAVRATWMAARFDPARKAGRAVPSRIQIEVSYDPPARTR